jgi:hypothetical protein
MDAKKFIKILREMPEGVERDLFLFRWKNSQGKFGIFSTKHNGDCAGNVLKVLEGKLVWEDFDIINGQRVCLELEKNFNAFINWLKMQIIPENYFD